MVNFAQASLGARDILVGTAILEVMGVILREEQHGRCHATDDIFLMNSVGILEEDLWLYLGYYFQYVWKSLYQLGFS